MPQNTELFQSTALAGTVDPAAHPSYRDKLNHWAIVRIQADQQSVIVTRFRTHSDAQGHLKFLHERLPNANFEVVYTPQTNEDN